MVPTILSARLLDTGVSAKTGFHLDVKNPALSLTIVQDAPKGPVTSLLTNSITSTDVAFFVILGTGKFVKCSKHMSTKQFLWFPKLGIGPEKSIENVLHKFVIGRVKLVWYPGGPSFSDTHYNMSRTCSSCSQSTATTIGRLQTLRSSWDSNAQSSHGNNSAQGQARA